MLAPPSCAPSAFFKEVFWFPKYAVTEALSHLFALLWFGIRRVAWVDMPGWVDTILDMYLVFMRGLPVSFLKCLYSAFFIPQHYLCLQALRYELIFKYNFYFSWKKFVRLRSGGWLKCRPEDSLGVALVVPQHSQGGHLPQTPHP